MIKISKVVFTCEQERTRLWSSFSKEILPFWHPSCYSAFRKYRKIELQIIWSPCQLQTHYNNSTGMTTSLTSLTIRIWRIFECEGLMVGWCAKWLKGPGLHLVNYLTPLQLIWLRKLSKNLKRWTDKIENILRRIWFFEPHTCVLW